MKWIFLIALGMSLLTPMVNAAILWAGGEDMDFPNGAPTCVVTTAGLFRAGYAREAVYPCSNAQTLVSTTFPGGPVTSAWVTARLYFINFGFMHRILGLGKNGTGNSIWIGWTNTKIGLYKSDGTTTTLLASEASASLNDNALTKIDMQVINYGTSATVNIYVNGGTTPRVTYTGDITMGGNTNMNAVFLSNYSSTTTRFSEIIVSDQDTRSLSLATLAPAASGSAGSGWTGTYSNINPLTINDSINISSANPSDTFQSKLNTLPVGSFSILSVKVGARAVKTLTGPSSLSLGVATNGSSSVPSSQSLQTAWNNYETYYPNNPVTSGAWTKTEVDALEILLQSAP